ncbi:hypothetical protein [Streptomyces sp. N2A]|uniref:hypothetical protein n=1 Tax=Streptomyces sp. N2A TaxID=3073936 RepID=UPI00286FE897|nr:hypothetical protein [Streptomyces sp. N2A]
MTDIQTAAWHLYVVLHGLAAAQVHGELPGDINDAQCRLAQHGPVLAQQHPALVDAVRDVVDGWEDDPAGRLTALLPAMDELSCLSDAALPDTLPPINVMR